MKGENYGFVAAVSPLLLLLLRSFLVLIGGGVEKRGEINISPSFFYGFFAGLCCCFPCYVTFHKANFVPRQKVSHFRRECHNFKIAYRSLPKLTSLR